MGRWMMFGEVVGTVVFTGSPMYVELALAQAVLEPVVAHVDGFGSLHAHGSMKDAMGGGIVGFEWCAARWLWVTHFLEGSANGNRFLGVEKQATDFGFGGGSCDGAERFAEDVNGAVGGRGGG